MPLARDTRLTFRPGAVILRVSVGSWAAGKQKMRDPKGLWHRRAAPWFDLALAAAATTGVTAVVLWISAERGRLSMPPKFDDVSYMIDGLR